MKTKHSVGICAKFAPLFIFPVFLTVIPQSTHAADGGDRDAPSFKNEVSHATASNP